MKNNSFPVIETLRLRMRKLNASDWETVLFLRSDDTINRYIDRPRSETKEKALEFIQKTNKSVENKQAYFWVITERDKQNMIGNICLWNFSNEGKTAEIGYELRSEFQGKGIMNETLQAVIIFAFENLNIEFIKAFTHKDNTSSKNLLEKNEFILVEKEIAKNNNVLYELKKPEAKI